MNSNSAINAILHNDEKEALKKDLEELERKKSKMPAYQSFTKNFDTKYTSFLEQPPEKANWEDFQMRMLRKAKYALGVTDNEIYKTLYENHSPEQAKALVQAYASRFKGRD